MFLSTGTRLGPYQILDLLGAGGMGEVYRARDTRLDRTVALKVLPTRFLNQADQRARFEREARAISALSHPRICTLYDVGEEDGTPFLVMEYLTGETLAAHLTRGSLPVARAIRLGAEIAEGLAAAHKFGIVHRDLKPGNVMLTPTGVKLLDFGLAKLEEFEVTTEHGSVATTIDLITAEGVIVGSRPYMAPEQLEGKVTDARADIWALGAILYEMIAGRRAFSNASAVGLMAAILEREPESLATVRPDTPPALERIVSRCLAKDPEERWYSAHDVADELVWIAQESSTAIQPPATRHRRRWMQRARVAVGLLAAGIAGGLLVSWWPSVMPGHSLAEAEPGRPAGFRAGVLLARPRQVTSAPGWEASPAISPDGSLIAYASDESGNPDIWIIGVGGTSALRLTDAAASEEKPCWYPDGRTIAFVSDRGGGPAIWQVPVLGGSATMLLPKARDPAIDPSGTRIAFVSSTSDRIVVAELASPAKQVVLTGDHDGLWNHRDPAWSPDGRTIAYAAQRGLWTVPAGGGTARPLTTDDEADEEPVWSSDGRYVYFKSFREGTQALWRVPASGGSAERMTLGNGPEGHPSLSRDGRNLVFATFTNNPDVIVRDLGTASEAALPNGRSEYMPTFSHDGRMLLFVSDRGGQPRLWQQPISARRPAGPAQVLTDHHGAYPTYSPDRRWVAYYRLARGEPRALAIVPSAGGASAPLTDSPDRQLYPAWSPRGDQIAFVSERDGGSQIVLMPVRDGRPEGAPRTLVSERGQYEAPVWSPEGDFVAYIAATGDGSRAVRTIRSDGTEAARQITPAGPYMRARWHPGGRLVLVSAQRPGGIEVLQVSSAGGTPWSMQPPVRIGRNPGLVDFDVSHDGRLLTFAREAPAGDIWMVEVTSP